MAENWNVIYKREKKRKLETEKETEASIGLLQKLWESISPSYQSSEETEIITKGEITETIFHARTALSVSTVPSHIDLSLRVKLLNKGRDS